MNPDRIINHECTVYTRYLAGMYPDAYVVKKYAEALQPGGRLSNDNISRFDVLLLKLAVLHPLFTRAMDSFSRIFRPHSALRKRLILLLAILESCISSSEQLDKIKDTGRTKFFVTLIFNGLSMSFLLIITSLLLLPFYFILDRE